MRHHFHPRLGAISVLLAFAFLFPSQARAAETRLTWFGHAAFAITTPSGKTLIVDPWITNPANPNGKAHLAGLTKVDLILISHGHADHVGDAVAIAQKTGAKLVAVSDLGGTLTKKGQFPKAQAGMETLGQFGGEMQLLDGEVTISIVPAIHSSVFSPQGSEESYTGGSPGGFLITIRNGPVIYHTGDTDVFGDMAMIVRDRPVDFMLACIGGHYTMDPRRAAEAVRIVKPKTVIPMHFGTFPLLKGTPAELERAIKKTGSAAKMRVMQIGQTILL